VFHRKTACLAVSHPRNGINDPGSAWTRLDGSHLRAGRGHAGVSQPWKCPL